MKSIKKPTVNDLGRTVGRGRSHIRSSPIALTIISDDGMLEELVMIEQFLVRVPEDLRIWLRDRKSTSLWQAATLADGYALARWNSQRSQNSSKPMSSTLSSVCPQETPATNLSGQVHRNRLPSGLATIIWGGTRPTWGATRSVSNVENWNTWCTIARTAKFRRPNQS